VNVENLLCGALLRLERGEERRSDNCADYRRAGTIVVDSRVAVTSTREILRDIARKQGPQKSLLAFGYAGWGPGQLDGEMALRAWFTAQEDVDLIFDLDRARVWDEAMKRRTQDL